MRTVRALALCLIFAGAAAAEDRPAQARWTCPVAERARVMQANGGRYSHNDPLNRYAWDYQLKVGTPIVAARDGVVHKVDDLSHIGGPHRKFLADANRVVIRHADGTESLYLHLKRGSIPVRVGERVIRGERIGLSGNSGFTNTPHLHFGVMKDGRSFSIRFADFKNHDGKPLKGELHGPAPKPAVPQADLSRYKYLLRGAEEARRRKWPEIVVAITHGHRLRHDRHHDHRQLESLRAEALKQIRSWLKKPRDDSAAHQLFLVRLDFASLENQDIEEAAQAAEAIASAKAARLLREAAANDCLGRHPEAIVRYGRVMETRARPEVRREAERRLRALIARAIAPPIAALVRLADESTRSLSRHNPRLKNAADEALGAVRGQIALARNYLRKVPGLDKVEAEAVRQHGKVLSNLKKPR